MATKKKIGGMHKLAWLLVVIGAINWGLVGLWNLDLVRALFGFGMLTQLIYILIGVAGVYKLWMGLKK